MAASHVACRRFHRGEQPCPLSGRSTCVAVPSESCRRISPAALRPALGAAECGGTDDRRAAGCRGIGEHASIRPLLAITGLSVAAAAVAIRLGWFASPAADRGPLDWAVMVLDVAGGCRPRRRAFVCPARRVLAVSCSARSCWPRKAGPGHGTFGTRSRLDRPQQSRRTMRLTAAHAAMLGRTSGHSHALAAATRKRPYFPKKSPSNSPAARRPTGPNELSGWLRMPFAAGQRTGSMHVAFCPPFAATPELAVEQIDGPEVRIKTAQLLPYGARLDLKLAAAAEEPTAVLLQFSARTPGLGTGHFSADILPMRRAEYMDLSLPRREGRPFVAARRFLTLHHSATKMTVPVRLIFEIAGYNFQDVRNLRTHGRLGHSDSRGQPGRVVRRRRAGACSRYWSPIPTWCTRPEA